MSFPIASNLSSIPFITAEEMRYIDKWMINDLNINLSQMMENAGRALARFCSNLFFQGTAQGAKISVLTGGGGNGGGGMVAARHLSNWGADISVILTKPIEHLRHTTRHQHNILTKMNITMLNQSEINTLTGADLIIDALIGYSLKGPPWGDTENLIRLANQSNVPIVSLDIPSGIDATLGACYKSHIIASATLTLALPKIGLRLNKAQIAVGELYLADISVPPSLFKRLQYNIPPLFGKHEIIRLW